jgi:NADPH2:quinone reductase
MKAWWTVPDSRSLELRNLPLPEPKAGEMRIKVRAASLNRGEFLHSPSHQGANEARPAGSDAAGEVDALGDGVSGWSLGDRLMGPVRGAYAEYAIADPRLCSHAPEALSWEEAAAVPIVFQVTYDMLWTQGRLQPGEWLLVTGISSGVGVASLQAAKAIGAKVVGTSGSRAKLDALKKLGLDVAIETRAPDFSARVLDATGGKGADLVVNNVGGTVFAECVKSMAYKGRLATVGYLDNTFEAKIDLNALHAKRLHLFGVSARYRPVEERAESLVAFRRDMLPLFAAGKIRPVIDRVFSLADMPQAQHRMESNAQVGKIVLRM